MYCCTWNGVYCCMIGSLGTGVLLYLERCVLYWCMIGSLGTGVLLYLERGVLLYNWFPEYRCTAVGT